MTNSYQRFCELVFLYRGNSFIGSSVVEVLWSSYSLSRQFFLLSFLVKDSLRESTMKLRLQNRKQRTLMPYMTPPLEIFKIINWFYLGFFRKDIETPERFLWKVATLFTWVLTLLEQLQQPFNSELLIRKEWMNVSYGKRCETWCADKRHDSA